MLYPLQSKSLSISKITRDGGEKDIFCEGACIVPAAKLLQRTRKIQLEDFADIRPIITLKISSPPSQMISSPLQTCSLLPSADPPPFPFTTRSHISETKVLNQVDEENHSGAQDELGELSKNYKQDESDDLGEFGESK